MSEIQSKDPVFGSMITQYLNTELPQPNLSPKNRFEAVSALFMGTLQTRLGPLPSPEVQVAIRSILQRYFDEGAPIQVLVPFGPKKPGEGVLDIAELYVIKHLLSLNKRVSEFYVKGLSIHVRLENLTGLWMEGQDCAQQINQYCETFEALSDVLGGNETIHVIRESDVMAEEEFFFQAKKATPIFTEAVRAIDQHRELRTETFGTLIALGWSGPINEDLVAHYLRKYHSIYPDKPLEELYVILGKYLAAALTRKRLGGTGVLSPAIKIFFGPAVPASYIEPVVHRRHMPLHCSKTHVIPWRAKGYFKITNDPNNTIGPAQTNWNEQLDFHQHELSIKGRHLSVPVRADYVLQE